MIFQGLKQFAEGLSLTRQSMYLSVGANLLNFGLNYLLIYGHGGFPRMGLNGAAIATLISRIVMALLMVAFIWQSPRFAKYRQHTQRKLLSLKHVRRIFKLGLPIAGQMLFEMSAFSFSAIMIGWLGAKQLAAHQIAINVASVTYMMASGIAAAATIRVSNELGRGRFMEMRQAGFSSIMMALFFMTAMAGILIISKNYIPLFYVQDTVVIEISAGLLVIAALFQLSDGVQVAGLGALRGLEDVKVPGIISFLAYWVVGLPTGYILGFKLHMGVNGIWTGLLAGLSVAAVLLFFRFKKLTTFHLRKS
jgi:MATE family multidrug resistance protein